MNGIGVEYLRTFSGWLWEASWQGTLLAAVVLAVQWLLKKHLSARWRNALWLLVLARLLLPALPHTGFSVYNWLRPASRAHLPVASDALRTYYVLRDPQPNPFEANLEANLDPIAPVTVTSEAAYPEPPQSPPAPNASPTSSILPSLLPLVWMVGCLALSAYTAFMYLRLNNKVRFLRADAPDCLKKQFMEAKAEMKVNRGELVVSEAVLTPFVTGFWKARVILPVGLEEKLSPEDLRMVLLHELAHIKKGDLGMAWVSWLAGTIHWFNPFIRFAFTLARRDREMACDEWVLRVVSDARAYGAALLRFMELQEAPARSASFGTIGIFESKSALFQRAHRIAAYRRPTAFSAATGCAVLLVLGLFTLTSASNQEMPISDIAWVNNPIWTNSEWLSAIQIMSLPTPNVPIRIPPVSGNSKSEVGVLILGNPADPAAITMDGPVLRRKTMGPAFMDPTNSLGSTPSARHKLPPRDNWRSKSLNGTPPEKQADVVLASGADRLGAPPKSTILDAGAAARRAASLANAEARRQFGSAPFAPAQDTPTFSNGRWEWQATAGYGKGDLQAIVSFTQTGSKPEVRLQTLILAPPVQ